MSNSSFSVWDGSVATGFAGGTGTENNPYRINAASQLAYLEKVFNDPNAKTNTYYSKYYKLASNIDLDKREWSPIGDYSKMPDADYRNLAIHFDGNNHIIRGLFIDTPNKSGRALFGNIYKQSSFKNVTIEGAYVSGDINVGGLIGQFASGYSVGGIENCHFSGEIRGNQRVGGIAGSGTGTYLRNCTNYGKITCGSSGGGISGSFSGSSCEITNCINYGPISGGSSIGGINTNALNTTIYKYCQNYGEITATGATFTNAGGIASQNGKFEYCSNSGTINGSGGIVGTGMIGGYLKNCHNSGTINGVSG